MSSAGLKSLSDWLGKYANTGIVLEPGAVLTIRAVLEAEAEEYARLENMTVPRIVRIEELPENVTRFSDHKEPKETKA